VGAHERVSGCAQPSDRHAEGRDCELTARSCWGQHLAFGRAYTAASLHNRQCVFYIVVATRSSGFCLACSGATRHSPSDACPMRPGGRQPWVALYSAQVHAGIAMRRRPCDFGCFFLTHLAFGPCWEPEGVFVQISLGAVRLPRHVNRVARRCSWTQAFNPCTLTLFPQQCLRQLGVLIW